MQITPLSSLKSLHTQQLAEQLIYLNSNYRAGSTVVSDHQFDAMLNELTNRDPNHSFIKGIQPEKVDAKGRIAHKRPMLSTDKAYTLDEVKTWLNKLADFFGKTINDCHELVRITPKYDGCAGKYRHGEKQQLITRGDGQFGNDFTHLKQRLVLDILNIDQSEIIGEVICDELYFQTVLKPAGVAHPRNFVAGILSAETLNPIATKALEDGAVKFIDFRSIPSTVTLPLSKVLEELDSIESSIIASSPYRTDGIVMQIHDDKSFDSMGHNNQFHYAQLAKKQKGEAVESTITGIKWSIGRSGRYTPILEIEPIELSGSIVRNVTAHHAGNLKQQKLGIGAVGAFLKSGEIIPFIQKVLKPSSQCEIPTQCKQCNTTLIWEGDFLKCDNNTCKGRLASQIEFTCKTLGMDLIGSKSAERLANGGITLSHIFTNLSEPILCDLGFGKGQAANILAEVNRIKMSPIEDYKILASLGIHTLGKRASRNILSVHSLQATQTLTFNDIAAIEGFAEVKANAIFNGLIENHQLLNIITDFFDDIVTSKIEVQSHAPLLNEYIVFTGTMSMGTRSEMETYAAKLGANVQSSVNKKTTYLICGANVGASKTAKATALGVKVLSEKAYMSLIG